MLLRIDLPLYKNFLLEYLLEYKQYHYEIINTLLIIMNTKIESENLTAIFSPLAGASLRSLVVSKSSEKYDVISNREKRT